jgi:translation initiation factor IF-2
LLVAHHPGEIDLCKDRVNRELGSALGRIQLQERGVYVQASTLGSLEALLEFLKKSEIPVRSIVQLLSIHLNFPLHERFMTRFVDSIQTFG